MEKLPRSPKTTHGAKKRSAPTSTHLSKKSLRRSESDPKSAHRGSGDNKNRSTPRKTHNPRNPIDNLGRYAHKAKMPTGKKIGVSAAKSVAAEITSNKRKPRYV
jgi:hypothetical protein